MKTKTSFAIVLGILLCVVFAGIISAKTGAIWTTLNDCGDSTQNVNEYAFGDIVYINGANFATGNYSWDITGQPGSSDPSTIVASGIREIIVNVTNPDGEFCFPAYTIELYDDGVYKYNFNGKNDNYHVNMPANVPEFTGIIAGLTIVGALGAFLVVRKN